MSDMEPFDEALIEYYRARTNWKRFRELVLRAAKAHDDRARYAMATWYLHGHKELKIRQDHRVALRWLRAATRSSALAMHDLANAYETGQLGLKKNDRLAFQLYTKASDYGSVAGRYEAGRCLFYGIGVTEDRRRARRLLTAARKLGASDNP